MKYDASSTEEDPVMYVEGKDIHGKAFTTKIHLNDVDAAHATPAELTALRVHLAQQGDPQEKQRDPFDGPYQPSGCGLALRS